MRADVKQNRAKIATAALNIHPRPTAEEERAIRVAIAGLTAPAIPPAYSSRWRERGLRENAGAESGYGSPAAE